MDNEKQKYRDAIMHCAIDMILIAEDEKKLSRFMCDASLTPLLKTLRDTVETEFLVGD